MLEGEACMDFNRGRLQHVVTKGLSYFLCLFILIVRWRCEKMGLLAREDLCNSSLVLSGVKDSKYFQVSP